MTYKQLIKHYGTQVSAAKALGVTKAAVCQWQHTGVPALRQFQVELLTGGKLRADRKNAA
jgi:predicted transcriptional regulator